MYTQWKLTCSSGVVVVGRVYCDTVWDGWGCWNFTLAGTRAFISCPSYKSGFDPRRQYQPITICRLLLPLMSTESAGNVLLAARTLRSLIASCHPLIKLSGPNYQPRQLQLPTRSIITVIQFHDYTTITYSSVTIACNCKWPMCCRNAQHVHLQTAVYQPPCICL